MVEEELLLLQPIEAQVLQIEVQVQVQQQALQRVQQHEARVMEPLVSVLLQRNQVLS